MQCAAVLGRMVDVCPRSEQHLQWQHNMVCGLLGRGAPDCWPAPCSLPAFINTNQLPNVLTAGLAPSTACLLSPCSPAPRKTNLEALHAVNSRRHLQRRALARLVHKIGVSSIRAVLLKGRRIACSRAQEGLKTVGGGSGSSAVQLTGQSGLIRALRFGNAALLTRSVTRFRRLGQRQASLQRVLSRRAPLVSLTFRG